MSYLKRPRQGKNTSQSQSFLNLVLFGETGVGKSSFINTLANFLSFTSFDEAEQGEPKCVIPCSFNMTDDQYQSIKIQIGDPNESEKVSTGDSVTQKAMHYTFDVNVNGKTRKLNIIDTPGVGDTRGIEQDKANIKNVIEYLNDFGGLNAICILLLPNASRFTLQFRYCFKELLVNLTRDTAPNICFCYTNSRGTFFKPGENYPMLLNELEKIEKEDQVKIPRKDNFFCFDSEVFRYLAAKKQNIKFEQQEIESFKSSWSKGSEALLKLVAYAAGLSQASVKPIFLLSKARLLLMELSKPVAELSRNIQINKNLIEDKKKEMQNSSDTDELIDDDLFIDQVDLETVELDQPKTVCHNPSCTQVVNFGGEQKINYNSDCHAPCYLEDVQVDVIAHPAIKECHAFDCGKLDMCMQCGHSWMEHLHIRREFREVLVQVLDMNVKKKLDQKAQRADVIQEAIKSYENMIREFEDEQKKLIKASANLAKYIKRNGILYYNSDLEEYLSLLIKEEEQKKQAGGKNDAVLDGLRQVKANFISEVDILKKSLTSGGNDIATEEDIEQLMDELTKLKHTGASLVNMLKKPKPGK